MTMPDNHVPAPFFAGRNNATRIDVFEELSHTAKGALRTFCRRLGAPHLMDEVFVPTLEDGDSSIFVAVRDRPWPPWGVGARTVTALCQVQTISDESYAVSPVYVTDEELTNVGLMAALFKEVLDSLTISPRAELNYLVADGAVLTARVLESLGFGRSEDVFLTEQARYHTWRTPVEKVISALELDKYATPDLLAHDVPTDTLLRQATFFHTIYLGSRAEWTDARLSAAEIIQLVRGGHAGKPGGVPGGTGRFGYPAGTDGPDWFYVTLEGFLRDAQQGLLEYAVEHEQEFSKATIVEDEDGKPVVDERLRRARTLSDLGDFAPRFEGRLKEVLSPVLSQLKMEPFPVGEIEIQITASGDGDFFRMHKDGDDQSTRELSFVYFFHGEPRRYSGGELRIFDAEVIHGREVPTDRSQILSPRQDVVVFFPSQNEHELLPVRVPSKSFADSRFTVNGWIHRANG
jgi:Rps23 Pro-64 3,4-dihydroxylase Tpa1-like proline 4-hydroxylase